MIAIKTSKEEKIITTAQKSFAIHWNIKQDINVAQRTSKIRSDAVFDVM